MGSKQFILFALFVCMLSATAANAQERTRHWELSVAGSMQAYVGKYETEHYLSVPLRVGSFITPNILIEAEGIVTGWDEDFWGETEFGYIVSLNGSYNITRVENVMPFFLAGIGFSNGMPLSNAVLISDEDGPKPTVVNAGAGMKILLSPMAALRVEYRLQDFNGEKTERIGNYTYTEEIDVTLHSVFFGVSLFF